MTDEADVPTRGSDIEVATPTARERATLRRVRWMSDLLDEAVRIPFTDYRVGLDPVLSVLPVGGSAIGAAISVYVVLEAIRLGAPKLLVARMVLNIVVDFAGGAIPILGVLFDALWKANERNVSLLERYIEGS